MTQKLMRLEVSRNVRFTLKIQKIDYFEKQESLKKNMLVQNDISLPPSNITLFSRTPSSFLIHKNTKKSDKSWYESDIYIISSICRQQLFRSLRAHQCSSDQMKILKDQSAHTTTRAVGVAFHLWLYIYIFSAIFAFTFTHRSTGTNKPRWQSVAFDLVIQL